MNGPAMGAVRIVMATCWGVIGLYAFWKVIRMLVYKKRTENSLALELVIDFVTIYTSSFL